MNKQQLKLLHYSYDLLATRRYTIREMIKKLDTKNEKLKEACSPVELEEILASLIKSNFLNDKIFAEFYIDAQTRRKPTGIFKLKQQLKLKGIDQPLIDQAINSAELDETQLARELLQKKMKAMRLDYSDLTKPPSSDNYEQRQQAYDHQMKLKQKLFRFLQSNGFPTSIVFSLIESESHERSD